MRLQLLCLTLFGTVAHLHPLVQEDNSLAFFNTSSADTDFLSADAVDAFLYNISRTDTESNTGYTCNPRPLLPWRQILKANCVGAMNQFPTNTQQHWFTRMGPEMWRVPQERSSGDCSIKVDIRDLTVGVESSWIRLKAAMTRVLVSCPDGRVSKTYGGRSSTGTDGKLVVTINRRGTREEGGQPLASSQLPSPTQTLFASF
ncbi:MAG: hypothetical protein LQ342_003944 [Letrouitia transgressa]|nr:MAG: hypothetical protein LQ342_003944 [Letrouitia transgressa]